MSVDSDKTNLRRLTIMGGRFFSKFFAVIITMLLSVSLYAQENEVPNAIDDCNVILGAGFVYHGYTETDDFRKSTGSFKDEIKWGIGVQFNAELLLNDTFSLSLPVGLAAGYRFQTMEGGYKYSTFSGDTLERKVQLQNNIAYFNVLLPIDDEKYWLLGCSAGIGASTYKYTLEFSNPASTDLSKSAKGTIVPLSVFFDWGADGIGARFGYTYVISKYADIEGYTPKGSGNQFFLDLRYAI
jgi:hypothetical protein